MHHSFSLHTNSKDILLRSIRPSDLENLRSWKNENRKSFFFQEVISPIMQNMWFEGYLNRSDDYMFIVQSPQYEIGCMGFRLLSGKADIYNVILGNREAGGQGLMSKALNLMCSYIISLSIHEIGLKVLSSNPAVKWYIKNEFV